MEEDEVVFYPFVSDRFEEATHIVGRNALHNDGQKGLKVFCFGLFSYGWLA